MDVPQPTRGQEVEGRSARRDPTSSDAFAAGALGTMTALAAVPSAYICSREWGWIGGIAGFLGGTMLVLPVAFGLVFAGFLFRGWHRARHPAPAHGAIGPAGPTTVAFAPLPEGSNSAPAALAFGCCAGVGTVLGALWSLSALALMIAHLAAIPDSHAWRDVRVGGWAPVACAGATVLMASVVGFLASRRRPTAVYLTLGILGACSVLATAVAFGSLRWESHRMRSATLTAPPHSIRAAVGHWDIGTRATVIISSAALALLSGTVLLRYRRWSAGRIADPSEPRVHGAGAESG